jgi:hypothetical protein
METVKKIISLMLQVIVPAALEPISVGKNLTYLVG